MNIQTVTTTKRIIEVRGQEYDLDMIESGFAKRGSNPGDAGMYKINWVDPKAAYKLYQEIRQAGVKPGVSRLIVETLETQSIG